MVLDVPDLLLHLRDVVRPAVALDDVLDRVIEGHLVIQVVHLALVQVLPVQGWIVDLGQQQCLGELNLDGRVQVAPEFHGNHFRHVVSQAVDPFAKPEMGNVPELDPGIRDFFVLPELLVSPVVHFGVSLGKLVKILGPVGADAIVDLHSLIPVVEIGLGSSRSVARPFGRVFVEFAVSFRMGFPSQGKIAFLPFGNPEGFPDDVIEIVVAPVLLSLVVPGAEILHALGVVQTLILAGHVVRNDVDDHFHALPVGSLDQGLELLHPLFRVHSQVRVHVVIVLHGIGRARPPFDHVGVVIGDPMGSVVRNHGVVKDPRVPDMRDPELPDLPQGLVREIVEFSHPVLFDGPPGLVQAVLIPEESGEHLVDDFLLFFHNRFFRFGLCPSFALRQQEQGQEQKKQF